MNVLPQQTAARENTVRGETAKTHGVNALGSGKLWRLWSCACSGILLLAAFAHQLLALIKYAAGSGLFSYILLVPFVSEYLLHLRRGQLPKRSFSGGGAPLPPVLAALGRFCTSRMALENSSTSSKLR